MPFLAHFPRDEPTAPPLGGGERFELVADPRLRLIADLQPVTAASSTGLALLCEGLPSSHARRPVVWAQRAGEWRLGGRGVARRVHADIISKVARREPDGHPGCRVRMVAISEPPLRAPCSGAGVCPGCGALLPAEAGPTHPYIRAWPACWARYGEVLAREFGDPDYFRLHQLTG